MNQVKKYLWVESYSPTTVEDCILPENIKSKFLTFRDEKRFPNLILAGPAGVGKTSLVRALCQEIDADVLFVNASLDRGIGDVRTTVAGFASTSSMYGGQKVVILDEADNLTQDSQKALRALIEEFQNHCTFALTANYPHNIIDAIHSRCSVFDFNVFGDRSLTQLSGEMFKRCISILKQNNITFDKDTLAKYIMDNAPDWRSILNGLQGNTTDGKLDVSILNQSVETLIDCIASKNYDGARDWIFSNSHIPPSQVLRKLTSQIEKRLKRTPSCYGSAFDYIGTYAERVANDADPLISLQTLVTMLMMDDSVVFE